MVSFSPSCLVEDAPWMDKSWAAILCQSDGPNSQIKAELPVKVKHSFDSTEEKAE